MVSSIVLLSFAAALFAGLAAKAVERIYTRGFVAGMRREAAGWLAAMDRLRPPNWQSLPLLRPDDRKGSEDLNKSLAAAYAAALEPIRDDIIAARAAAMMEDARRGVLFDPPA